LADSLTLALSLFLLLLQAWLVDQLCSSDHRWQTDLRTGHQRVSIFLFSAELKGCHSKLFLAVLIALAADNGLSAAHWGGQKLEPGSRDSLMLATAWCID
jgi:hypothetical protein